MKRVMLAYDASDGAAVAADLVQALPWSAGSAVRVVAAIEPMVGGGALSLSGVELPPSPEVEAEIVAYYRDEVGHVVERLEGAGLAAEGQVLAGRPGSVLVDEATRAASDLVVVGSRGHGAIATLVLGSVSAELVDHAPCPVLVARRPRAKRVLLATDGSSSARHAGEILAGWPIFEGATVRVLSVADVARPWRSGMAPTMVDLAMRAYTDELVAATSRHERIARSAADALGAAGHTADARVRTGDAAAEIVAEAADWRADLVVLGSRGLTGLSRIVLGSVARNVLQGTKSSVLVVRGPRTAGAAQT